MPVIIKNAPDNSFYEFKKHAHYFHPGEIKVDDEGRHHHFIPHKIFNVDVGDILAGNGLTNAVQTGWRYLFEDANGVTHVAEVSLNEAMDEHAFHHVNVGSHVNSLVDNYSDLGTHELLIKKDYEINIIRIPAIYVMAIWMKGTDHSHEFFIPLAPVHSKFEAGKTYEYDAFVNLLQEAAQNMVSIPPDPVPYLPQDDLTMIEGIGPKLADILKNAGYPSFQSLARASSDDLKTILVAEGYPYNTYDPSTWPDQANLATEGRWEALKQLQDVLKGGRR